MNMQKKVFATYTCLFVSIFLMGGNPLMNDVEASEDLEASSGTYFVETDIGDARILTLTANGNIFVIASSQSQSLFNGFPFSDGQGIWKGTGRREITATVLNFSFPEGGRALAWIPTAAIDLRISPARQVVETLVDGLTPYG
jgi:hypothetical protein